MVDKTVFLNTSCCTLAILSLLYGVAQGSVSKHAADELSQRHNLTQSTLDGPPRSTTR